METIKEISSINTLTFKDLAIKKNMVTLFYYDEPLLYCGQTNNNDYIIGVAVENDIDNGIYRHIHIQVTKEELDRYLNRQISLLDLYKRSGSIIFIIDIAGENNIVYCTDVNNLPKNYLPSEDSFNPGY